MLSLEMSEIYLSATNSNGNLVSQLWGDTDSTQLTAGTRNLHLRAMILTSTRTAETSMAAIQGDELPYVLLDSTGIHLTPKSSRSSSCTGPSTINCPTLCLRWSSGITGRSESTAQRLHQGADRGHRIHDIRGQPAISPRLRRGSPSATLNRSEGACQVPR